MSPRSSRINARLTPGLAKKVAYLARRMNKSATTIVHESLEAYYVAVCGEATSPAEILEREGFIACAEGPRDLSSRYKHELTRSLSKKT